MGISEKMQVLKDIKPYFPTFEYYRKDLILYLDNSIGTGEITLDQYKHYMNDLENLCISLPNLALIHLAQIMKKDFKFHLDVKMLLSVRKYLDDYYCYLKSACSQNENFISEVLSDLISAIQQKDFNKSYDLFYFFVCWIRCHNLNELKFFNNQAVGSVYQIIVKHFLDEIQNQQMESLQVFGKIGDFKLNANAIGFVVLKTLELKDEKESFKFAANVVSSYYKIGSLESIQIIESLAQVLIHLCKVESDYAELLKMVEIIRKYSKFSIIDVLGIDVVNSLIRFITLYFENFDDTCCYSFLISNQLYFSNATNADDVRKTKEDIRNLLSDYEIIDYDKILD